MSVPAGVVPTQQRTRSIRIRPSKNLRQWVDLALVVGVIAGIVLLAAIIRGEYSGSTYALLKASLFICVPLALAKSRLVVLLAALGYIFLYGLINLPLAFQRGYGVLQLALAAACGAAAIIMIRVAGRGNWSDPYAQPMSATDWIMGGTTAVIGLGWIAIRLRYVFSDALDFYLH